MTLKLCMCWYWQLIDYFMKFGLNFVFTTISAAIIMRPEIFIFLDLFPPSFRYCFSLLCYFVQQFLSKVAGYEQKTEQKRDWKYWTQFTPCYIWFPQFFHITCCLVWFPCIAQQTRHVPNTRPTNIIQCMFPTLVKQFIPELLGTTCVMCPWRSDLSNVLV